MGILASARRCCLAMDAEALRRRSRAPGRLDTCPPRELDRPQCSKIGPPFSVRFRFEACAALGSLWDRGDSSRRTGAAADLRGRATSARCSTTLVDAIRRGEGRSLVVRGEAGIGKTALLEYLVGSASDLTVLRAVGVESEMELAYAGLHQLCASAARSARQAAGSAASGSGDRVRSERRRSSGSVPCRAGRFEPALRGWPMSDRSCAWSMTRSGWIGPRR